MIDGKIVSDIQSTLDKASSAWNPCLNQMIDDFRFYNGDQWGENDMSELKKRGVPSLVINRVKKVVDLIVGIQRQNKALLGVKPIEGSDDMLAEVLQRLVIWTSKSNSFESRWSSSFKDAAICGLGWAYLHMNYEQDPINGDLELKQLSPFDTLPDPDFKELDLSDCSYIFHHKKVDKKKLKAYYPKYAEEIERAKSSDRNSIFEQWKQQTCFDTDKQVEVIEYWHREYEDRWFTIDAQQNMREWTGKDMIALDVYSQEQGVSKVKRKIPCMKLTIVAGDDVVLYDGDNPYGTDDFPHQPIFGYYTQSFDDWSWKIQGIVRPLKDVQKELNKRRSQIMQAVLKMPLSGLIAEEGSIDDTGNLGKMGGKGGQILKYRKGFNPPTPLPPPIIPNALIGLEQSFANDITMIGVNPDLLGMVSDAGSAGVTLQLRKQQGLTSMQEVFDNLSSSYRMLGIKLVKMIIRNYTPDKIKRVLGTDFPITEQIKELQQQDQQLQQQITTAMHQSSAAVGTMPETDRLVKEEEFRAQSEQQANMIQNQIKGLTEEEQKFWSDFAEERIMFKYDCVVDEVNNTPTARMASLAQLQQLAQSGIQVPPEFWLELADIPKTMKDKLLAILQQQKEQQQQMMQMQMQQQQQQNQLEYMKAMAGMSGKIDPMQMQNGMGQGQPNNGGIQQ